MDYNPNILIDLNYTNFIKQIHVSEFLLSIPVYVWSVLYLISSVIILIYSIILLFHWSSYRAYGPLIVIARIIYLVGIVVLLYMSGSFLINYLY
jgi:hypothetical protein